MTRGVPALQEPINNEADQRCQCGHIRYTHDGKWPGYGQCYAAESYKANGHIALCHCKEFVLADAV